MSGVRFYGLFDQAGIFSPAAGEQAAAFRALPGVMPHDLVKRPGYFGNLGYLHPIGVADTPLVPVSAYFGTAPASIQPSISKPDPWTDPVGN